MSELRYVNGQRGRVAIFKLDDRSESIEAVANEEQIEAYKALLVEDELVIVQGKVQTDRFNGGLRLNIGQMWDLPAARARFGRHLAMAVDGGVPALLDLVRTWPARRIDSDEGERLQGLGMRLLLSRPLASAELDLGDSGRFWPCDEALARCKALAHEGRANVVYE